MKKMKPFLKRFQKSRQFLTTAFLTLGLAAGSAANPRGPTVRHGQVDIVGGPHAQIQQLTDRAIVDWQSFSIGANESVQFLQPGQLSVILNRVTGGDASSILGQLSANGNVFLINPNGILFGPSSVVSVGGLVASSLDITDQEFLSGSYSFESVSGKDLGAVVNQGRIQVTNGGYAVLTGASVINEGIIVARGGNVTLAAGEKATLNLDGRDLVHFSIDSKLSEGTVLLAPGMMSDAIAETLGVERYERADRLIEQPDGSVLMLASAGTLVQDGIVSANGLENGSKGGSILLESTDLTLLTESSVTSASGAGTGDGGQVLVLSDMDSGTTFVESGSLIAADSPEGNGGFIETSAGVVGVAGRIDASGGLNPGTYLLDPTFNATRIVDELYTGGGSFVTDLTLETALDMNMDAIVQSSAGIISDVTATSAAEGGTDTGIQSAGMGNLIFDTLTLGGTDVDLQSDRFTLGGGFDISTQGNVDLGTATIDVDGVFSINASGNVDLGSAQITADQGANLIANPGGIIGDGVSIDTRQDPTNFLDGGELRISAAGDIVLNNATLQFAQPFSVGGLEITTDGTIQISNSMLLSESETVSGSRPQYKAAARIESNSLSNDLTLSNTTLTGTDITLRGDNVNLQTANIDTTVRDTGGAVPFTPTIRIDSEGGINGPAGNNSLHAALIDLSSNSGNVQANIDTSTDGDDAGVPYTSIPTQLTVDAPNGDILIQDVAQSSALGIDLRRPGGLGTPLAPGTQSIVAGGDITITSEGKIGFGLGNGTTVPDSGTEFVTTSDPTATITFNAVGPLIDQNGTTGNSSPLEIVGGETISLSSDTGIGSITNDPFGTGVFEVTTSNLVIDSAGAATEVNVGGPNFSNVDITTDGGELKITAQANADSLEITANAANVDILEIGPNFANVNTVVRVSSAEDLGVLNSTFSGQTLVLATTNGARILNEDPSGTGNPSVTLTGGGSRLVLSSSGGTGTQSDPFRVQGETVLVGDTTSSVFLDLTPATAPQITLGGAGSGFFTDPVNSLPGPAATAMTLGGDIVVWATADLDLISSVTSSAGIALQSTGIIDLTNSLTGITATDGVIIKASQLVGADARLGGGVVGLELGENLGTAVNPIELTDFSGLVVGNDPARSYFLTDDGTGDAALLDSFSVGGVTVSGNQTDTLQIERTQGSLTVEGTVTGNSRLELKTAGDISQGTNGQLNSAAVVLDAGGNIGAISNDQRINGSTLSVTSGGNAYLRDTGGDLDLVEDASLSSGVGAQNDFRVRVDNGDLTVSTDVTANDIALVGGSDLEIAPQTTAQDVFLAGNVSAANNLVVIAAGDIVPVSGSLSANGIGLGAGGNIGTASNPVFLDASQLTLNKPGAHIQTGSTPTNVDSVTAAGATVNAQTVNPNEEIDDAVSDFPPGAIGVEVVLFPQDTVAGSVFAQDNVDMVEDFLETLRDPEDILEDVLDPTSMPLDWYNDDDFLRQKWRS